MEATRRQVVRGGAAAWPAWPGWPPAHTGSAALAALAALTGLRDGVKPAEPRSGLPAVPRTQARGLNFPQKTLFWKNLMEISVNLFQILGGKKRKNGQKIWKT